MRTSRIRIGGLLAGLIAVLAVAAATTGFDWFAYSGAFHRALTVNGPVDLSVQTGSGSIRVSRGGSGSVIIDAHIRGRYQERVHEIETNPPVHQEGNVIEVGKLPDDLGRDVSITYDITTPADSAVKVSSGSGDDTVSGVTGNVRASTGSGSLQLRSLGGWVEASTGSGNAELDDVGGAAHVSTGSGSVVVARAGGGVRASTGSGDVTITAPGGAVQAATGSGTIRVDQVGAALEAHTGSGNIEVGGSLPVGARWDLQSGSGDVDLHLPATTAAALDAYSGSGSIVVDHPLTVEGRLNRNHIHGFLNQTAPGNGTTIVAHTSSGSIRIQ